jgi:hypothetical protein
VPPLRDFSGLRFTLEKIKEKGKEPPSLPSLPSSQDSAQHSAAVNLVLPAPCLVVRSRRLPSHRVTHPQISDRTASCAHRKPHGRGGPGFHVSDSPSVTSCVFPRQGGGRASITRCASPVRGPILRVSSRLVGLLHRASSTQGRIRGIEILYRRRWEENWRGMHSTS